MAFTRPAPLHIPATRPRNSQSRFFDSQNGLWHTELTAPVIIERRGIFCSEVCHASLQDKLWQGDRTRARSKRLAALALRWIIPCFPSKARLAPVRRLPALA